MAYKIINHGKFETVIMTVIILSSLKLVFDTYTADLAPDHPVTRASDNFDFCLQVIFTIEMCMKIVAFGFVMDENSYLTESWSKLDCFIVSTGLMDTL